MLNSLTVPPIICIYMGNNRKSLTERRNHGLSLTNLTHCISPSEYYNDYYNNNSFNNINLQLHASSEVSNPYSFSIMTILYQISCFFYMFRRHIYIIHLCIH